VEADEPDLAVLLRVEEIDLDRRVSSDTNGGRRCKENGGRTKGNRPPSSRLGSGVDGRASEEGSYPFTSLIERMPSCFKPLVGKRVRRTPPGLG
jgi:hypothetical protein